MELVDAEQIDKPLYMRRKKHDSKGDLLFELDHSSNRSRGQLDPSQLEAALHASFNGNLATVGMLFGTQAVDDSCRLDDAHGATLNVLFACHRYQSAHGEFPTTLEDLVPDFLDVIPFDPMDPMGNPLRYRRLSSDDARVWSVGQKNEVDDGGNGDIEAERDLDSGFRISVKR